MDESIHFYSTRGEYGAFSNFAGYPFRLDGRTWPTTEHDFQAMKFEDDAIRDRIRAAKSPMIAARMGRDRKKPLRRDWESVKVDVMRRAVRAKFEQHADLAELLLRTGERTLVEHTDRDAFWGDGGDGSGRNWLGRILMEVRSELRDPDEADDGSA